jgi:hypothetical protein
LKRRIERTHLDAASLAVNAVLAVDDQPLPHRILLSSLRVDVFVNRRRADPPEKSSVLLDVGLDVSSAGVLLDVEVDRLIFGVVGVGSGDGGENVEGKNAIGFGVVNGGVLTMKREAMSASPSKRRIEERGRRGKLDAPRLLRRRPILLRVVERPRSTTAEDERLKARVDHPTPVLQLRVERRADVADLEELLRDP